MPHRFFYDGSFDVDQLLLDGSEAHHLLHVLRMQAGDTVLVFNGTGAEAEGVISKISRKTVEVQVTARHAAQAKSQTPLILATAVPKGDRFRWLVEKAAELGVTKLVPLLTRRSSVDPGENRLKKLQQTIVSAAKQSGQIQLMELAEVQKWDEFLSEISQTECRLLIADPAGSGVDFFRSGEKRESPVVILIGPEGGFTPDELQSAQEKGAKSVRLSEGILRIETAAILFAGLIRLTEPSAEA
ncbi:RsmE family RNA methyltransferase [Gimesia maris]|uniref:RsmE family RNA methyltransferase n=1 Tax=Gimesia maris TaxID=122 RepID=UPI00118CC520|nr:RsmE family RNA methyltransferase [Gimesia maris]QDT76979.1 Ribosomal RNA small subunit methyltransferase E [Gimesia maris]|tara:strand:- start:387981 stop:388709 length:729 start_codon:yes stop_codon:yes gene_type:complete